MKLKPINIIILVLVVLLLGIFIYYKMLQPQAPTAPKSGTGVSAQQIEEGRQQGESMWLLFRSDTCPSCVELKKVYDRLEPEYKGKVRFISIDVNDKNNAQLAQEYGISYIPATFIIDGEGELSYEQVGIIEEDELRAELDKVVKQ
jgi:thioredoxin-like negative regulator of GroEL